MINDNVKNCERYYALNPDLKKVFDFLKTVSTDTPDGKYVISDTAYVNVMTSNVQPIEQRKYENHGVYADLQYMAVGNERIDIADREGLTVTEDKMEKSDAELLTDAEKYSSVVLSNGDFAFIFPGEAHKPLISTDGKVASVKKAVGKIKVRMTL